MSRFSPLAPDAVVSLVRPSVDLVNIVGHIVLVRTMYSIYQYLLFFTVQAFTTVVGPSFY